MNKIMVYMGALILVILICYLSWIPDPQLIHVPFIPSWLGKWADSFTRLRTGCPFIILSFLFAFNISSKYNALISFCLLVLVEWIQLFIPHRHFDLHDIFWGFAGILLGILLQKLYRKIFST